MTLSNSAYDVVIIGTGAGGSTLAYALATTGKRILILERGNFLVRTKDNWSADRVFRKEMYHTPERWLTESGREFRPGQAYLVGGNTKLFGAALLRLRKRDFTDIAYADGVSPAWPISYEELEPYYQAAERLYFVHGERGEDPSEPPAAHPYPFPRLSHEPRISEVYDQLKARGLHPFHLPIGVQRYEEDLPNSPCIRCNTCDGFPCLANAKGDAERSCLIHALAHPNVTLITGAQVERLETDTSGRRVSQIHARVAGQGISYQAETVALAAGAINSAVILLKSSNAKHPNGLANASDLVGKNYMCHNNSAMLALDFTKENPTLFQKTIGLNDYYEGKPDGPVGHIQLVGKATEGILKARKPFAPRLVLDYMARHSVDWWFCTEDLPKPESRVSLTSEGRIRLVHPPTNQGPHGRLIAAFKKVLRQIGFQVMLTEAMPIEAVAHQVGTVVFGREPGRSVLDPHCRAHDVENLYVVDGSFFPSSSHCNPALTIAANALRVGDHLKKLWGIPVDQETVLLA